MTRRAGRVDAVQQRVAVAVVADLLDRHRVPRRRALVPVLLPRPAPEPGLTGLTGAAERLLVHRMRASALDPVAASWTIAGRSVLTFHPTSFSSAFSSGSRSGRSCTIDAISAASAPTANASARWRVSPAPPEAITGTSTASATRSRQLEVVARARAVRVDRRQQDLARPALDRLARPVDRVAAAGFGPRA